MPHGFYVQELNIIDKCNRLSLMSWLCCVVFRIGLIVMLRVSVLCSCRVLLCVVKHPFRAMCYPVNVYCDRDISCMVIVTYHVLISVLLVSYVVSIQCRLISVRFTSIDKTSNSCLHCCFCFRPRLLGLIEVQLLRRNP